MSFIVFCTPGCLARVPPSLLKVSQMMSDPPEKIDKIWDDLDLVVTTLKPADRALNSLADVNQESYRSYNVFPMLETMIEDTEKTGTLAKRSLPI
eukprot:gene147-1755_t